MKALTLSLILIFSTLPAKAYFSLMDTGNIKRRGEYRILGEGQILMDDPKGFNLNGRFATGIDEESELQFEAGVGSIDYYLGGFWKWIPFPDTVDQPAIGGRAGFVYANYNQFSTYGFNITPMISKRLETNSGDFTPYGGIEMGLLHNVNSTNFTLQAVLGMEWKPNRWDFPNMSDFQFLIEYGIGMNKAFDYISLGSSYDF